MRGKPMRLREGFAGLVVAVVVSAIIVLVGCSSNTASVSQSSAVSNVSSSQTDGIEAPVGSAERRTINEETGVEFMYAFYNDWDFKDGNVTYSIEAFNRRSLPFIAEGTALYDELSEDNSFGMGSESRFIRTAALHAAEVNLEMRADDVCVVEVLYCGTQNDVTQEWYDDMMKRLSSATWTLVFDEVGKITSMEEGDVADEFIRDDYQSDAKDNGAVGDGDYLGVNRAVSLYVEMACNIDWKSVPVDRCDRWHAFNASSEPPERFALLAFTYLLRHDSSSVESCSSPTSAIDANTSEKAEYNVRVKLEMLEGTVERLYGVQVDLTSLSGPGQWGDSLYYDGYVYFNITNGEGFLAGAALADSIVANGDGIYQVKCGIYSNNTGNKFDPDDDSVYAGTPEELMRRYGDVERVADATAIVELEDDGRFTLKEFSHADQGAKVTELFESGYGDVRVNLTPGFGFIEQPSSICNWDLSLTAVTLSGLVYSSESAASVLKRLGYDDARYSYRDELMHTTSCFGYKNIDGGNVFAIVVRGTRGETGSDVDLLTDLVDGTTAMFDATKGYVMEDFEDFAESATGKSIEQLKTEENYFFITGHSLGAAVANCLSVDGEIMELVSGDKDKIYAYTFESPHTCINLWWMDPASMSNAFNFKDNDDAVTHLPPYAGSATYGTDVSFDVTQLDNGVFTALFPNAKGGSVTEAPKEENYGSSVAGQTLGHHDRGLDLTLIVQEGVSNGVWQSVDDVLAYSN